MVDILCYVVTQVHTLMVKQTQLTRQVAVLRWKLKEIQQSLWIGMEL